MGRVLAVCLVLAYTFQGFGQTVTSTFNSTTDGWTAPGASGGTINWISTGGNPGGFVRATDPVSAAAPIYWSFLAPAAYKGNITAYYNGTLQFDLQQGVTRAAVQRVDVTIQSGSAVLSYTSPTPPYPATAPGWTRYTVELNELSGNWLTTLGSPATAADFASIMATVSTITIRGRYGDSPLTTGGLDNVIMQQFYVSTQPTGQTVCDGMMVNLTSAGTGIGTVTYQWQKFNPLTGGWVNLTNGGGYSNVSTSIMTINTTGNFGAGSYRAKISKTGANPIFSNSAAVAINALPAAPGTSGNSACGPSTVTVNASGASAGQYRWYTLPSGGTAIVGQTASSYAAFINSTTNYYAAINNGTCESVRTPVTATIIPLPTAPTTTPGSSCGPGTITLTASGGAAGQYRWYGVLSGGSPFALETNSTFVTPSLSTTKTYYVSIDNGTCESTRTPVDAVVNPIPASPTTTPGNRCGPGTEMLSANGAAAGEYRWYTLASGGSPIAGETNGTYTTPVLSTTTTYYAAINQLSCESSRTAVVAAINSIPIAPSVSATSPICGPGTLTLTATGGTNGQYRWYNLASGGSAIAGQTAATFVTPVINTTTTYFASIDNGICESTRSPVDAIIYSIPAAPTTIPGSTCGPGTVSLSASGGISGQYRWYTVAAGGTALAGQTNNSFTTPFISTTTTYFVAINNGNCEGPRVPVVATVDPCLSNQPPVIAPASAATTIGGTASISLTPLLSDADNNINLPSLKIKTQPLSGARATIDATYNLKIDYSGIRFAGEDKLSIEVCDFLNSCGQQAISVEVTGDIIVYNGLSPNADGKNDLWIIQNIESIAETRSNHVLLFNRWGDIVFETEDYDNNSHVFKGIGKNGSELPPGTYYYKIEFTSGRAPLTGFLALKR